MNSQDMNINNLNLGRRSVKFMLLCLILIWSVTVPAQSGSQNPAELHETYDLNPGGTVSVQNVSGYIRVTGWDENKVRVDAIKRPQRGSEDLSRVEIRVLATADRVEIRTLYPRSDRGADISVDYDLKVPRSAIINSLSSVSGNISLSGAGARAVVRSTSGEISAQSIGGEANLATTSGAIMAKDIKGALTIRTTSGALQITEVGSNLSVGSTSGTVRAAAIRDDAIISSTSGDIRIERVGGRVGARSVSGAVYASDVSGDVEAGSSSDSVVVERVKGRLTASTISGRITARNIEEGVRAGSVSGTIELTGIKGAIGADSTSGSILLRDLASDDVRARSFSGTVRFQSRVSDKGRYILDSFSGELIVALPTATDFEILAKTSSGEIETDFPVQVGPGTNLDSARRRLQATHGKGGAQFALTTFSASIRIRKQ